MGAGLELQEFLLQGSEVNGEGACWRGAGRNGGGEEGVVCVWGCRLW